jgi:hypothetical protein
MNKFRVNITSDKYKDLEGIYKSIDDIKHTIDLLKYGTIKFEGDYWTCPSCGHNENYFFENKCRSGECNFINMSIWYNIKIDREGQIFISGSGRMSVCYFLGYISNVYSQKYIKENRNSI